MSRAHDGHRSFFPVGNPFRAILPGGPHLSRKLQELLASYEDALALSLRKLKPEAASEVLTLSWMRLAVDCLSKLHTNIGNLITELELPVSDWDDKWVDIYLNSSVKLLDICIALSSELARLDQGQLLVQYILHVLDSGSGVPSLEQLKKAEASLKEWIEQVDARSPRLDGCSTALQELAGNLCVMKAKNCPKGKVLMRALYGIEAVTVLICGVFVAALSSSSKPMVEVHVPEKFGWSQAFNDLHASISGELRRQLSRESVAAVKELEEVKSCVKRLYVLTCNAQLDEGSASLANAVSNSKEVLMSDSNAQKGDLVDNLKLADDTTKECGNEDNVKLADDTTKESENEDNVKLVDDTTQECEVIMSESIISITEVTEEGTQEAEMKQETYTISNANEVTMLERTNDEGRQDKKIKQDNGINSENNTAVHDSSIWEGREELMSCISRMSKSAEGLRLGLNSLSKQVGDFFQIVLTGRDALLCNLRISDATGKVAEVRS